MAQLTEQQKYLLDRLPSTYNLKAPITAEPATVQRAREVIAAFEEKKQKAFSERKVRFHKNLTAVREAIYFKPSGDALRMVQDLETDFPEAIKR